MESNYKIAYQVEWNKLKKLNPADVSNRLEIEYNNEKRQFIVPFLKKDYILDIKTETIYRREDKFKPNIEDCIIILNYLTYSKSFVPNRNKWVTLKEIPNGGALFYPAFYNMTILELINTFGENINKFEACSIQLGGNKTKLGDKGYKFNVLPKIDICVVLWEGDDEIDANATILFDISIQYLLHIETIIALGMCVTGKIIFS